MFRTNTNTNTNDIFFEGSEEGSDFLSNKLNIRKENYTSLI